MTRVVGWGPFRWRMEREARSTIERAVRHAAEEAGRQAAKTPPPATESGLAEPPPQPEAEIVETITRHLGSEATNELLKSLSRLVANATLPEENKVKVALYLSGSASRGTQVATWAKLRQSITLGLTPLVAVAMLADPNLTDAERTQAILHLPPLPSIKYDPIAGKFHIVDNDV